MNSLPVGGRLATVTVTYHPDVDILRRQAAQLPSDALRIIVDNASRPDEVAALRKLASDLRLRLIENTTNLGLAAASNLGIDAAIALGCSEVLLLDQDTEPGGGVQALCDAYRRLRAEGAPIGCIGPRLIDAATGLDHGFHQIRGWRWVRVWPAPGDVAPIRCANLNGSGTLIPREVLDALGGLDAEFFIDHVDTEWAFRVLAAGFCLYGAPGVVFRHRMGDSTWRFWWFGWRIWPYRSPLRHSYLFRNAVQLLRRGYVPLVWKAWAVVKLAMTMGVHLVFDRHRFAQMAAMMQGACAGMRQSETTGVRSER